MPRYLYLEPHLSNDELEARYRSCHDPVERSHWADMGISPGCWRAGSRYRFISFGRYLYKERVTVQVQPQLKWQWALASTTLIWASTGNNVDTAVSSVYEHTCIAYLL